MASVLDPHYVWAFGHVTVLANAGACNNNGGGGSRQRWMEVMGEVGMRAGCVEQGFVTHPSLRPSQSGHRPNSCLTLTSSHIPCPLTLLTPAYIVFQTLLFRGTPNIPYRLLYVGALLSYSIVVFKSLGKPTGVPWLRRAFVDENAQYALLAFYW